MAKTWYNNEVSDRGLESAINHPAQAYIIAFGVNDAGHVNAGDDIYSLGIGNIQDINLNDYNYNKDSFYGWYAKIIQRMDDLNGGAIFCLTLPEAIHPEGNEAYHKITVAIREIVDYLQKNTDINVNLVDLLENYNDFYKNPPISSMYYEGHYQAAAYAVMANIIADGIDSVIYENPSRFRYYELVR